MTEPGDQASGIAERPGEDTRFIQAMPDASPGISFEYPFILPELPCGHIGSGQKLNRSLSRKNLVIRLPPDPTGAAAEPLEGSVQTADVGE